MTANVGNFVRRLTAVLGEPWTPDPELLSKELGRLLSGYSAEELDEAATLLFATQKDRKWPTPNAMLIAAREAREKLARLRSRPIGRRRRIDSIGEPYYARTKTEEEAYHSREAHDAARKLIKSDMGRKAAHEGWIGDLYDFCRENRRLPDPGEAGKLIRRSRKTDELYAQVCTQLDSPQEIDPAKVKNSTWKAAAVPSRSLLIRQKSLIETFLKRREDLAAIADGAS